VTPVLVIALANLCRPRRADTAPREPFVDVPRARQALAAEGIAIGGLADSDLPRLTRLVDAVSELADRLALGRQPPNHPVTVINELATACVGTIRATIHGRSVRSDLVWRDPDPVSGLARRVIEELAGTDPGRLRQCQRQACNLLFFDATRSRSQRWHAENPCGWLERQRRHRGDTRRTNV
jgi:predicted RNA-binding Zn ribbon-like protein